MLVYCQGLIKIKSCNKSFTQVKSMPVRSSAASNIKVSDDDELIKEEIKEEEQFRSKLDLNNILFHRLTL